jgi:thymidine kinase
MNFNKKMFANQKKESGYLELIIGPMYAGKTSKLLEIYKQCKFCNIPVVVINYGEDKRYHEEMLSTHDKIMIPCIQLIDLSGIYYSNYHYLSDNPELVEKADNQNSQIWNAQVVLINEAQFFKDLKVVVNHMLGEGKKVYVSGLDGDFKREKFGEILDLIPICDKVTKLKSLCSLCKDGTNAIFSLRLTCEEQQKVIGSDNYIPVCRNCYENFILEKKEKK